MKGQEYRPIAALGYLHIISPPLGFLILRFLLVVVVVVIIRTDSMAPRCTVTLPSTHNNTLKYSLTPRYTFYKEQQ